MPLRARSDIAGVTLIELLVTLAVLAILLTVAVPSFAAFRQRTALVGAADQLVSAWTTARFEALRRNQLLKVSVVNAGGEFCIGAVDTQDPADNAACDCFEADPSAVGYCAVSVYPGDQAEWGGVTATGAATLGGGSGVAVIDPKRGGLTQTSDAGGITLQSADYRLSVFFDRRGRAIICEPADAPEKISRYAERGCVL